MRTMDLRPIYQATVRASKLIETYEACKTYEMRKNFTFFKYLHALRSYF